MTPREQGIAFTRNYCVHYDGGNCPLKDTIKRAETPNADGTRLLKWGPCIGGHTLKNPLSYCAKWERPSLEAAEKEEDESEAFMQRVALATPVINAWKEKAPKGKAEVIECPACKGRLHLKQSAFNGHVRAQCETEKCVSFRE